jgi:pyruvate formate lyase activating enzyme
MIIGGLQKFSLLDYPEHLAAIVFTQGCNFRCQFCYNPMLVWPNKVGKLRDINSSENEEVEKVHPVITEDDLFDFLEGRRGKLDAVVITGGEPSLHADLPDFTARIKGLGFKVKLDTNGTNPDMLKILLDGSLLDYLAMDLKAAPDKYDLVTASQPDLDALRTSIEQIMASGLAYEFRTTVVPGLTGPDDIPAIGKLIEGAEKWFLQDFRSDLELVNGEFKGVRGYSAKELEKMRLAGSRFVKFCALR